LRVGGVGEEHTFVAGGLFILADAAWLVERVSPCLVEQCRRYENTFGFEVGSSLGLRSAARLLMVPTAEEDDGDDAEDGQ
jgi:hypothetical protein